MNFEIDTPAKSSYKFNEVTSITAVKPYVLRFWETEFSEISPELLEDGSKNYTQSDIDSIMTIKDLLFEQKMSIPEAKLHIQKLQQVTQESVLQNQSQDLKFIKGKKIN